MSKIKYRFNPKTLSYERVDRGVAGWIKNLLIFAAAGLLFAIFFLMVGYPLIESAEVKRLKQEKEYLSLQYEMLNDQLSDVSGELQQIREKDDNIYRVIFEAEPVSDEERKAGIGGYQKYAKYKGHESSEMVIETAKKLDKIKGQLKVQTESYNEVLKLAREKARMLAAVPAIQPISNKDLARVSSGFGYRIDPHYKYRKFHNGMDFTAPTGTEIYATGGGVIMEVEKSNRGLGHHVVISHGYGYKTIYAHMSEILVRKGQNIKRGQVIGYVGSTGKSTAPHLHYEVLKDDKYVNPVNFYYNDLTPEEYERMIELSSKENQSFD